MECVFAPTKELMKRASYQFQMVKVQCSPTIPQSQASDGIWLSGVLLRGLVLSRDNLETTLILGLAGGKFYQKPFEPEVVLWATTWN